MSSEHGSEVSGLVEMTFLPRTTPLIPGLRINLSTVQRATESSFKTEVISVASVAKNGAVSEVWQAEFRRGGADLGLACCLIM